MPAQLIIEKLINKNWDSDPMSLFEAMDTPGDNPLFVAEGKGGLGRATLESELARAAFNMEINTKKLFLKARNILHLAKLADDIGNGFAPFKKNMNKYTICLMLIVRQPNEGYTVLPSGLTITTEQVITEKAKAFKALKKVYTTQIAYKTQTLKDGRLVLTAIEAMESEFKNETMVHLIHPLQISTPKFTGSPESSGGRPRSTSQSNSQTPPSMSLTPRSSPPSESPPMRSMSAHFNDIDSTGDESKEHTKKASREVVQTMLKAMTATTIHPAKVYKLHEIKVVQKIFFNRNIYSLTFRQLWYLSNYMYNIQRKLEKDGSFDEIRTETNVLRRFFGYSSGNTQTWQEMAHELQELLLTLLLRDKKAAHLKLALPSSEFDDYARFFSRSFTRTTWGTPAVLKRFREHCIPTRENDSPTIPARPLSSIGPR
jgi:hypothetical protein